MFDLLRQGYDTRANIEANLDKLVPLELVITTDTNEILYKDTQGNLITPTAKEVLDMLEQKANLSGANFTGDIGINTDKYFSFNKAQSGLEWRIKEINSTGQLNLSQYLDDDYVSSVFNIGADDIVNFVRPVFAEGKDLKGIISKSPNGYTKFPNGMIIQWGIFYGSPNSTVNLTFPTAFTSAHWSVSLSRSYANHSPEAKISTTVNKNDNIGATIRISTAQSGEHNTIDDYWWIAIGY